MIHIDIKKVGGILDGGRWRAHGRDSAAHRAAARAKTTGARGGYVYLHSAVDGFSRLAYTEHLPDEKGTTAAAFLTRAKAWFAAHGINHIHRIVTDNGACYRAGEFNLIIGTATRHQYTRPYTPRHNGKVERDNRILSEELLYARVYTSENRTRQRHRDPEHALQLPSTPQHRRRPPPASRVRDAVTNGLPCYN
ncbi:IS481 family transposase ISNfa1 [Austwickia sp. TVS 96-490-7B]|nr:IS481 family transposase ISNfa1 [Austwickia sp. TVS 96-490-7B]